MITRDTAIRCITLTAACLTLSLAGCTDDTALKKGGSDAGKAGDVRATTCQRDGRTYEVGATVDLDACTSCICQQDGTVGGCTFHCGPDAGAKDIATADTSGPVNACTQAGGSCVAVVPGSCASGTMNSSLSCGAGVGAVCCVPGSSGGSGGGGGGRSGAGGSSGAGGRSAAGGRSGAGGSIGAGGRNGAGGSSGTGGTPGPANACTEAGGSCVGVLPGSCASGTMNSSLSCGTGVGVACCMPGSSGVGGSSGRGGSIGAGGRTGAGGSSGTGGSTTGPANACTEAGGSCVGVFPGSCASGTTNSSLSCGTGVGVVCCMPGPSGGGAGGNTGGIVGRGGSATGGRSGAAGAGGRATGGTTGGGGTGGRGTDPDAAACGKAGGICVEQGECARQGGTLVPDGAGGCRFNDVPAECCITPAPQPDPTTCAEAGGMCSSIAGCQMAGGFFTATNYECSFPGPCCVPHTSCGDATIECCGDSVVYNAACQGGEFVCVVGSPVPLGTCKVPGR